MALYRLEERDVDLTIVVRSLEEIELLKLKYENLVRVCEQLLKPWSVGKDVAETDAKTTVETEERRSEAPPIFEIELLEKALEKARDVRNCHEFVELNPKPKKTNTTVQKSLQLAKTAYAPSNNPTKSQAHNRKAGNPTKLSATVNKKMVSSAKSHTKAIAAHKRTGMDLKLTTSMIGGSGEKDVASPSGFTRIVHPPHIQPHEQPLLSGSCRATQSGSSTSASAGQLRIQTDGMRLSMPSKYRRLQKAVERVASSFAESPSCGSAGAEAAQHFCARLAPYPAMVPDQHHQLQLLLARDELKLVAMELTSLIPHELSINQKQPVLTEILQIKAKLDLLSEAVRTPLVDSSSSLPTFSFNSDSGRCLPTSSFTSYSSLKEWQELSEHHLIHLWQTADRQMLLLCQLLVLPQLEKMDAADENFIPLLKSVYRLCKYKSPVFVSLETQTTR